MKKEIMMKGKEVRMKMEKEKKSDLSDSFILIMTQTATENLEHLKSYIQIHMMTKRTMIQLSIPKITVEIYFCLKKASFIIQIQKMSKLVRKDPKLPGQKLRKKLIKVNSIS
jgi:hypothetical protein